MDMISLYMNYCKLHFLFIFVHVDLEINLIDSGRVSIGTLLFHLSFSVTTTFLMEIRHEHVTSTLVTGTTAATFSSFEKVSQLTVKECIPNSAPKSCELDPIPSKLLMECLDSILPSLTYLFNSSLAPGIVPQCFKSALATPIKRAMSSPEK